MHNIKQSFRIAIGGARFIWTAREPVIATGREKINVS